MIQLSERQALRIEQRLARIEAGGGRDLRTANNVRLIRLELNKAKRRSRTK